MPDIRVAAIYDVHGNLPALEAALSAIERTDADLILVGGDVAWGPLPSETVERLLTVGERARFIQGDADRDAVESLADPDPDEDSLWCGLELTEEQRTFVTTQSATTVIDVDGLGPTLFCHGSPRSDRDRITAATPPEKVLPMLAGARERVIVCGHTHAQFDRQVGEYRIVNAGSVGLPFGDRGAYWALLGPDVDLRRSDYDYDDAVARIRAKPGPLVERFVERIRTPLPASTAAERWG